MDTQLAPLPQPQPNRTPIVVTSVISSLIFLTLGFLLGRYFPPKQSAIIPTPTPAPNEASSEVGWQTYTNTTFNFEIKYPVDWTIQTNSPSFIQLLGSNVSLMIADSNSEFMNECMKETKNEQVTLEKVNFLKRYFQEVNSGEMCSNPNPQNWQIWLIPKDSPMNFGMIFFYKQEDLSKSETLFNQILSTFKFTDAVKGQTGWKVYKNTRFGYEVSIPDSWTIESGLPSDNGSFTIRHGDYDFGLTIIPTSLKTIEDFLVESDKESQTAWEGSPAIQVISTQKTTINNYSVIQRQEKPLAAAFAKPVIQTYLLNHGNIYIFSLRYLGNNPQAPDNEDYQAILSTFKFLK